MSNEKEQVVLDRDVVEMIETEYIKIAFLKKSYYVLIGVIAGFVISTAFHMSVVNRLLDIVMK